MKTRFLVLFSVLIFVGAVVMTLADRGEDGVKSWWVHKPVTNLDNSSGEPNFGFNAENVKNFCEFMQNNPGLFDHSSFSDNVLASDVAIDGLNYKMIYRLNTNRTNGLYFQIEISGGDQKITIRDESLDGSVDWVTRSKFSFLYGGFKAESRTPGDEGLTQWMSEGNDDYERTMKVLLNHYKIKWIDK